MRRIETVVTQVAPDVTAVTVGVVFRNRRSNSQGSGVVVSEGVLDGPRSVVIQEARNRMLVQMAVLHRMLSG